MSAPWLPTSPATLLQMRGLAIPPMGGFLRSLVVIADTWTWAPPRPRPRSRRAADRTRSARWRAGTRRTRREAR